MPLKLTTRAFLIASLAVAGPVQAGVFLGGLVNTGSARPSGSPLKVRAQPKATAPAVGEVPDGDPISFTGPCRQFGAKGQLLRTINSRTLPPLTANATIHQLRVWCQVLIEPSPGKPAVGWVNAKYVDLN